MSVTAKLTVRLFAGDVLVAESEDARLWQRILSVLQEGGELAEAKPQAGALSAPAESPGGPLDGAVASLADELGVTPAAVQGACSPAAETPYLHLDPRNWEAFKKSLPARGPGAVGSTAVAGTLLALWKERLRVGPPTLGECMAVLRTLNVTDKNAGRSITNASWLQLRNGTVFVNPAERSRALEVARMFCSRS